MNNTVTTDKIEGFTFDNRLIMTVDITSVDYPELKKELEKWHKSHSCGMGKISIIMEKKMK